MMPQSLSKPEKAFLFLCCSFAVLLVVSNVIAGKIVILGGFFAPAAVACYSLTFAITDTIAEVWGKERTRFVVHIGFVMVVLSALFIRLAIVLPSAPFWDGQPAFTAVLGSNLRIVAASLVAYLVSQYHDIWAFLFWKKKTAGRHLWIRNNLSTIVSQLLDTAIFISLAFAGTGTPLYPIIVGQYIIKFVIALLDTPVVYSMVHLTKKYCEISSVQQNA